jgi:hypothetical protein
LEDFWKKERSFYRREKNDDVRNCRAKRKGIMRGIFSKNSLYQRRGEGGAGAGGAGAGGAGAAGESSTCKLTISKTLNTKALGHLLPILMSIVESNTRRK